MGNGEQPIYVAAHVTRWQGSRGRGKLSVLHFAARPAVAPYHFDSALDVEHWAFDVS